MPMPTGRSEKRTPIKLVVALSHTNEKSYRERTFTVNVSSHGLRAVTKRMWQPGARLRVSLAGRDIGEQASVVYCQRLPNKKFAVGLALSAEEQQSDD
jgi:PilZ domain-containing protein